LNKFQRKKKKWKIGRKMVKNGLIDQITTILTLKKESNK
jgi:hypothetical protein